jgi:cupin 2 domain-containing protein
MEPQELGQVPRTPHVGNLLAAIPSSLPDELHGTLLAQPNLQIERIVSTGQASPEGFWYDQDEHEWVMVVQGAACLRFEGEDQSIEMKAGDYLFIPAHKKHRVEWTSAAERTIWLAVYFV